MGETPTVVKWYTKNFCRDHDHKTPGEISACMIATLAELQSLQVEGHAQQVA